MKKILLLFFLFISYSSIGGNPVCGLTQGLTEISNPETRKWADASGANIGAFEATLALTKDQRNKYSISQLEEIKAYIASSKKSKLVVQGELANAYSKFGEYVAKASNGETAVLAMIKGIPDTNKSGIYTSIGNLGDDASRFLDDIASTVGVEGKLGGELGKLDEGLVGAWDIIKNFSDDVSRDIEALILISQDKNLLESCQRFNGIKTKKYSSTNEFDEAIIHYYTKPLVSGQLRKKGGEYYELYKKKIEDAIENLPSDLENTEIVYGGYFFHEDLIKQFVNRNMVEFGDLLSTSRSSDVANDFLTQRPNTNVYIEIVDSYDGKYIESLTSAPLEEEVLFRSDVIFQVKGEPKLIPHPSGKGTVLKVILEQM